MHIISYNTQRFYCSKCYHVEGWHRGKRASRKVFGAWFCVFDGYPQLAKTIGFSAGRNKLLIHYATRRWDFWQQRGICTSRSFRFLHILGFPFFPSPFPPHCLRSCLLMCPYHNPHNSCNLQPASSRACMGCCFRFLDIRYQTHTFFCSRPGQWALVSWCGFWIEGLGLGVAYTIGREGVLAGF